MISGQGVKRKEAESQKIIKLLCSIHAGISNPGYGISFNNIVSLTKLSRYRVRQVLNELMKYGVVKKSYESFYDENKEHMFVTVMYWLDEACVHRNPVVERELRKATWREAKAVSGAFGGGTPSAYYMSFSGKRRSSAPLIVW